MFDFVFSVLLCITKPSKIKRKRSLHFMWSECRFNLENANFLSFRQHKIFNNKFSLKVKVIESEQ